MTSTNEFTLADLVIAAAAEAWRDGGEVLGTGIGTIPRLALSLAKLTFAPEVMMTDGEAYLVEEPVPLGPRGDYRPKYSGWMPYGRVFDTLWGGRRHAMVTPVQVDRWGQANISCIGDFDRPKVQLLGMRGFPGNSVNHKDSMFVPRHAPRAFVEGEVDVVSSVGFKPQSWPEGARRDFIEMGIIVTDLCIMDFGGPDNAIRVRALHPGVTFESVQEATGFALAKADEITTTPAPSEEQLAIIARLDPHNMRAGVFKENYVIRRDEAA
jgi:glutaconate CoA-transferase subunit B